MLARGGLKDGKYLSFVSYSRFRRFFEVRAQRNDYHKMKHSLLGPTMTTENGAMAKKAPSVLFFFCLETKKKENDKKKL